MFELDCDLFSSRSFTTTYADAALCALYEHPGVDQCLTRTLLYTLMCDIGLLCRCLGGVDQRELISRCTQKNESRKQGVAERRVGTDAP